MSFPRSLYYTISDKGEVSPTDSDGFARVLDSPHRIIAKTSLIEKGEFVEVSTVFLGIDHSFGLDPPASEEEIAERVKLIPAEERAAREAEMRLSDSGPILFETMIFGGPRDGAQWRSRSKRAAQELHDYAVSVAFKPPEDEA